MAEPKIFAAEEDCRTNWTDSMADYNEADTHLAIEGKPVMERWETPFMNKLADIAASNGGKCLEVGFGMSISATQFQKNDITGKYNLKLCSKKAI